MTVEGAATADAGAAKLTPAHRRFLWRDAVLIAAIANGVLNALFAWLFTLGEDEVPKATAPLVGGTSVLVDTVATCFVLPFLTTLVITTVIWGEMRKGHLTRIPRAQSTLLDQLKHPRLRRATIVGLMCLFIFGPISAIGVLLFDYGDISVGAFVLYKMIFGIVLGAIVTPLIAMLAFSDDPPPEAS